MASPVALARGSVVIEIGGLPIRLCSEDPSFLALLEKRYAGFLTASATSPFEFEIEIAPPHPAGEVGGVRVEWDAGRWSLDRGDFHAEWNPSLARGHVRQTANPYSIDSVLRIVHTLLLAPEGGFLVHASSAVRNGRAFLFAGVSGAGKTTLARLAPRDATLLTDEISYVSARGGTYDAFGTPFAGELARSGENVRAPIAAVYLLTQGQENKIEPLDGGEALRGLLRNILFFARDPGMVRLVFQAACAFVARVPVRRLTFLPDARVWEMIA